MNDDTCGCCTGTSPRTPLVISNRPALPEIAYRSGRHGDFLASMVAGLSRLDRPALATLRTRDMDDPTMALLDAWAVACDVLTFYSERLANESYLRTATERISLQELGKLVAYRLNPGVAAETWLAFTLERPPAAPVLSPPDPGQQPPVVPASIKLQSGLRVQSIPGPGERPQTFETVEAIEARPGWNSLPVVRSAPYQPAAGSKDVWLKGSGLTLRAGETILFAAPESTSSRWDARVITSVERDTKGDRTHVRWDTALTSYTSVSPGQEIFVLRKRVAVFGHNAPKWRAMDESYRTGYVVTSGGSKVDPEWPPAYKAFNSDGTLDLEGSHPDITVASWVVLTMDRGVPNRAHYKVDQVAELSRSEFAVSGKVTRLWLDGVDHVFGSPRDVSVLALSEPLELAEGPDDGAIDDATLIVDGDASEMAVGRSLVLSGVSTDGEQVSEVVTLDSVSTSGGRSTLVLLDPPANKYERASAVVFGNIAHATHGESVHQILGNGDARMPFQAFGLAQPPLTFVPDDNPRGAASSLTVQVAGVTWREAATTHRSGRADRLFTTRDEAGGSVSVVFGDGRRGERLPTGSYNIRASYRKGIGAEGNVKSDAVSQALDRPLGLKAVTNPVPATGGVDREREDQARTSIPLPVRTLGRAVSVQDYADFALAFTGIAKAVAVMLPLQDGRGIVVSVADKDGLEPPQTTRQHLADALAEAGDPYVAVKVLAAQSASFRIAMTVTVDPDRTPAEVKAVVEAALRAAYSPAAREIGQPVFASAVHATAASVPGVLGVDLNRLYRTATPTLEQRLLAVQSHATGATAVGVELLGLFTGPFDELKAIQ